MQDFTKYIRDVPDFPKQGIVFRDITTLLRDKDAFRQVVDAFYDAYRDSGVDLVVGVGSAHRVDAVFWGGGCIVS